MTKTLPNFAGIREYRKARSTGTHVGLYDGEEQGLDTDGGRWSTVCEDHGSVVSHQTYADARAWMSTPEAWCEACMEVPR